MKNREAESINKNLQMKQTLILMASTIRNLRLAVKDCPQELAPGSTDPDMRIHMGALTHPNTTFSIPKMLECSETDSIGKSGLFVCSGGIIVCTDVFF